MEDSVTPGVLWTAGEIGKRMGIPPQTVSTWAYREQIIAPAFVTAGGWKLWTEEQVEAIIAEKQRHVEKRRRRAEARALEEHQMAIALKL